MPTKTKRKFHRYVSVLLLSILFLWLFSPLLTLVYAEKSETTVPQFPQERLQAKSAYLINADNGEVLFTHNEDSKLVPASLTKIMTLLIVNDKIKEGKIQLSDSVTISEKSWRTGGSRMFLEIGTVYSVEDLIKGAAVVSGNDASVSLAEHVSGSTDEFVKLMNQKAKELGMANTIFQTVNGLPTGNLKDSTTSKDLAILAKHYVNTYPEMLKIHSMKEYTAKQFPKSANLPKEITQPNNNTLLGEYEGMDGLKTGFADYYNFIGTAKKGEIRLIVVTLGSSSSSKRMDTATALLNYGFSQYKTYETGKKDDVIDTLTVYKAEGVREVDIVLKDDVTYGINIRDEENVKTENKIPDYLEGGLKKGDVVGKQIVTLDGKKLAESDIIVTKDLPETNWFVSIFHQIALFFSQLLNKLGDLL